MAGQIYPFTCDVAKFLHELDNGPAPDGYRYACMPLPVPGGHLWSIIYTLGMAATYLVQTVHERTGAYVDDVCVTTTHWRWDGVGDPDGSDFEVVTDRLDGFWLEIEHLRTTNIATVEHRWYVADPAPGPPNPTVFIKPAAAAGASTAAPLPPQCAITVTQTTDVRSRWGRFYMPGLTIS